MGVDPVYGDDQKAVPCEVLAIGNPVIDLSCEFEGETYDTNLFYQLDEGLIETFPVQVGQFIELGFATDEAGDADALRVRDRDTQRLLFVHYYGRVPPEELSAPDIPELIAPLSITVADTLCATDCDESQGTGAPAECDCERVLDLEFRAAPDAPVTVIRNASWSMVEVPGEADAFFGVDRAIACEGTISYRGYGWLYIAGPA